MVPDPVLTGALSEGGGRGGIADAAFAALAALAPPADGETGPSQAVAAWLAQARRRAGAADPAAALDAALRDPVPADAGLLALAGALGLGEIEIVAAALARAVETEPMVGHACDFLQAPCAGGRPTLGLLAVALAGLAAPCTTVHVLATGRALASGLLALDGEGRPLPARGLAFCLPVCHALAGYRAALAGVRLLRAGDGPALSAAVAEQARRHGRALAAQPGVGLALRSASLAEGCAVAAAVAGAAGREAVLVEAAPPAGFEPWLIAAGLLPVFRVDPAPGERAVLPDLRYYRGPVLALAGPDGTVAARDGMLAEWRIPVPDGRARSALWRTALGDPELAEALGRRYRHGAGRIARLAGLARTGAAARGATAPALHDVIDAAWTDEGDGFGGLAAPVDTAIADDALVVAPRLRDELETLLVRCRLRDGLADGLGVAARARYRCGVRALFIGPSGTGKSLAAGWVAGRLGVPMYRVDLAAVTSKWIGETEKNLARLLAAAEHADIGLLFDEADALFGRRTDVGDANDRHANAQTNYLLQRIEGFDGLVVLTANSRSRFDSGFTRRLDFIVEFALPDAQARRDLWLAHLGDAHVLAPRELNRLAAAADLAGGHIRNAVLTAQALALAAGVPIGWAHLLRGVEAEYRKLGRRPPQALAGA